MGNHPSVSSSRDEADNSINSSTQSQMPTDQQTNVRTKPLDEQVESLLLGTTTCAELGYN